MFIFGRVSEPIQSNWAAWSNWKSTGTAEEANKFYAETWEKAQEQGLTWFCYEQDL